MLSVGLKDFQVASKESGPGVGGMQVVVRVPRLSSSVRLKALMLELSFPVHSGPGHRGSGYNYGQKWTYLNGKYQEYGDWVKDRTCYVMSIVICYETSN